MKIVRVGGPNHFANGIKCRHCHKVCKKGQVVFDQYMTSAPTDKHFAVHAKCMAALVRKAPADHDAIAFEHHRDRILATGDPFAAPPSN